YDVVGLLYTRTCPLACAHCIIESSPRATDKMRFGAAAELLPAIARHTTRICFTGGEPLLYFNEILALVKAAKHLGLTTSVVSGAGWVRQARVAEERISRLRDAGLDKLCVSADRYHEVYSPPERAHLLIDIARRAGIDVIVRGVIAANQNSCQEKARFAPGDVVYDPVPLVRLGAARSLPEEHFQYTERPPSGRCKVALSPVVEPDGNVFACCGPSRYARKSSPLALGNINHESLDTILSRGAQDPILKALTLIGPYGLLELLEKHPATEQLVPMRRGYTGMCELCLDMTDSLEVVAALRARLTQTDAQALLAAAELWRRSRVQPAIPFSNAFPMITSTKEASNVTHQLLSAV
ncbi:MAG TPA: radical SAM/SPASM domain-containing protein, partial [Bryobacteraceae bacterium]|nr:radical SAM/SPASM domain-containing protein [Bryobacteraceae bacterium]